MHLSEYMTKHDLSDDDVAALIGRSRPTVSRIRRRILRPDWQTIAALKDATKGAVTADDFMDIEAVKKRAGAVRSARLNPSVKPSGMRRAFTGVRHD